MNEIAIRFLVRSFDLNETIALLLRRADPPSTRQRIARLEQVLQARYQAWLSYENRTGANIYVAANPVCSGSRKRTKESVATVRHLYLDIDQEGESRLAVLRSSDAAPAPTAIVSTSPGKYQVLWRVEGFDFAGQERTLKLLAMAFGGDRACTDRNRVLRVPGYLNHKYDPASPVMIEYLDDSVRTPDDFRLEEGAAAGPMLYAVARRTQPAKHSQSESDWAWVCDQLARAKDALNLTQELASNRSDKPNPLYYARRTVDLASARLWLINGIPIDDVIRMLERRRSLDIPTPVRSARASEVATTAQRMIARNKTS
jgi:hypothetical protein